MPKPLEILLKCILTLAMLFLLVLMLFGCASAPMAQPKAPLSMADAPVAAIEVSSCGKSLALFVVMDTQHMIRFSGGYAAIYDAMGPGQIPSERHVDAVPWENAAQLAERAPLTSHVVIPCREDVL